MENGNLENHLDTFLFKVHGKYLLLCIFVNQSHGQLVVKIMLCVVSAKTDGSFWLLLTVTD